MAAFDADLQAAYLYTFPYYEMARTRYLAVEYAGNPQRSSVNALRHQRALANHQARAVTTPNNDTLYSSVWLDLSSGPVDVVVPHMASRYWSFHFMDATTSTAAVVSARNAGEGRLRLWVVKAGDKTVPPPGAQVVTLATRDAWLLVRIVVDGPDDLAAVHALQDGIQLRAVSAGNAAAAPFAESVAPQPLRGSPQDGTNYLAVVNRMLARNGVPEAEQAMVASWAHLGFGAAGLGSSPVQQPGATPGMTPGAALTAALPELNDVVRSAGGLGAGARMVEGWSYPNPAIGVYGQDYALRAGVALGGLGALPPEEAIYLGASRDRTGAPLQGDFAYRLRVPASGIAAQAFWSLSMYQIEPDGRLFFTENPVHRFMIGDRTKGLVKNSDGSLDILLQHAQPTDARQQSNWLPAPAGAFRLVLRAYLPALDLAQGKAPLPVIDRLP